MTSKKPLHVRLRRPVKLDFRLMLRKERALVKHTAYRAERQVLISHRRSILPPQQPRQRRLHPQKRQNFPDFFLIPLFLPVIDRPDQDVLGRMLHVDELQDLGAVALIFQKLRPQGIGVQGGHPLLDQAVLEHRL